jgi:hypothetical protein
MVATDIDLKQLERRAWTSTFQDGLLDIFLGLLLLLNWAWPSFLAPIEPAGWRVAAEVAVMAALIAAFWAGKRFLTLPRLGRAEFGPARTSRRRKTAAVIGVAALLTGILLFVAIAAQQDPDGLGATLRSGEVWIGAGLALMAGLVIGAAAHLLDFPRGYVHALLYAGAFAAAEILNAPLGFAVAGGIGVVVGVFCLIRFLRDYPVPEEVSHGTES